MSFNVIPFKTEHLKDFPVQAGQRESYSVLSAEMITHFTNGMAFSAVQGDAVIGCAGLAFYSGVPFAWATFGEQLLTPAEFFFATRAVQMFLDGSPYERVFATIDTNFKNSVRWAKILKFTDIGPYVMTEPIRDNMRLYVYQNRRIAGLIGPREPRGSDAGGELNAVPSDSPLAN